MKPKQITNNAEREQHIFISAIACSGVPLMSIMFSLTLMSAEGRRMAQNPNEYLIEQLQFTGGESVGSSFNKIKLNFNHP